MILKCRDCKKESTLLVDGICYDCYKKIRNTETDILKRKSAKEGLGRNPKKSPDGNFGKTI